MVAMTGPGCNVVHWEGFRMTKKLAMATVMVLAMSGMAQAQAIDPVNTRQTGMDLLAGTYNFAKAVSAANGDVKTLEGAGKAIQRFGALMPSLFPLGSDKGATKASPAIWAAGPEGAAGFTKAAAALSSAGGTLATAAKAGDAAAVTVAIKSIGDACGACHKDYRLK